MIQAKGKAQMELTTPQRAVQQKTLQQRQLSVAPPFVLLALPFLFFLLLPLLALLLQTQPFALAANLANPQILQAVNLSLRTTLVSTLVTLIFGTPLAYWLARQRFRG